MADTLLISLYEFQTCIDCRFSILCSQGLFIHYYICEDYIF